MKKIIPLAFSLLCTICFAQSQNSTVVLPFGEFPAKKVIISSPPETINFKSIQARRFRTVIREESKKEVNFSGHYRIAVWGCGTDCREFAIIDLLSGNVFMAPSIETVSGVMGNDDPRLDFRPDSQLLVISGLINEDPTTEAKWFYRWDGKDFLLIEKQPLPKLQL